MEHDPSPQPAPDDVLLDLLERGVVALEAGDAGVLEALLRDHPEHADEIREQLGRLDRLGLLRRGAAKPIDDLASFGQYTVKRRLGSGGMGSVWLAEQSDPTPRTLALKVVKAGMDSEEVLARFDIERRALASMNHPHIAQLYDAGVTPQGRPYFAMEYVDGQTITAYADRHQLDPEQRLRLLLPVLDAVQHAHQKGVIHRDLKPSNILVTERDGVPTPKVIDFGVARALDAAASAATRFTAAGQLVGTPEYMSPEQVDGDVDTRTDVYALGVLLYELLTGSLPLERQALRRAGYREMLRQIQVQDPPTPSARITTLGDRTSTVATARRTTPSALRRRLRGDLDWITLKALEKERVRRYSTVKELCDDLRRHLAREPVLAGSPGAWYRAQRWVRRNRAVVVTTTALAAGLIASVGFGWEAAHARDRAVRNFDSAMAAVDEVLTRVGHADLEHVPHMEEVRRTILRRVVTFYEGFLAQQSDDPEVLSEMARVRMRLAEVHADLSEFEAAGERYTQAIADFEHLLERRPELDSARVGLATGQCGLAAVRMETQPERARELFAAGIDRLRDLRPVVGGEVEEHLAEALSDAAQLESQFDQANAAALYAESVGLLESLCAADPGDRQLAWSLLRARSDHALRLVAAGDGASARASLHRSAAEARRLLESGELSPGQRFECGRLLVNIGATHTDAGDLEGAVERYRVAADALATLALEFPAAAKFRYASATARNNLGSALERLYDPERAREAYLAATRELELLYEQQPSVWKYQSTLITTLANLGAVAASDGEPHLRRGAELATELLARRADDPHIQYTGAWAFTCLARHLASASRVAEAIEFWQRAAPLARRASETLIGVPAIHETLIDILKELGSAEHRRGDAGASEMHFLACVAASERALDQHPENTLLLRQAARIRVARAADLVATDAHLVAASLLDVDTLIAGQSIQALQGALGTLCLCMERARSDSALTVREREVAASGYARRSVDLLRRAALTGYDATDDVRQEPSLATLASHPEFEQWVKDRASAAMGR